MDLIDRQALLDSLDGVCGSGCSECCGVIEDVRQAIESAPAVQPTRSEIRRLAIQNEVFPQRSGEWIELDDDWIKCPLCGKEICYDANYCPECGAKMKYKTRTTPEKSNWDDEVIEIFWDDLEDVPFSENENGELILEEDWLYFDAGTTREDIWHWFDKNHSKGVFWLLLERNVKDGS